MGKCTTVGTQLDDATAANTSHAAQIALLHLGQRPSMLQTRQLFTQTQRQECPDSARQ